MRDFVGDHGRLVGWERYDSLAEFSFLIVLFPVIVMVSLLIFKGMLSSEDIIEFVNSQNQLQIAAVFMIVIILIFRLSLMKGNRIVFDREANELSSSFEFRFDLRWVERWRIDEIISVEAVRSHVGVAEPDRVVVTFKHGRPLSLGESTDRARVLATVQRVRTYLDL